ncbi:hypothetical protein OJ997_12345 [Solirubrobacter phytolaccae]|uniref:Uncharacterized protein n=1 Tax=Solirubrobacter phytolaccae TaxID=1404360 RepID=A0A9X3N9W1_9ACTN|nr:hypothetical protein [Solirubrobacter phytolaccae]MDA0181089.1 hypothetical protein [Solirubrobacter phytolaccae]
MYARKLIGSLVVATALIAPGAAHAAPLTCPQEPTVRVFRPWLDPSPYVPIGSFEADGWTLTGGASRVPGNEPWRVGGAGHATSLKLPAGATAVSPPVCISIDRPTIRFFARNTGAPLGRVRATVVVPTLLGELRLPIGVVLNPSERWSPTLPMPVIVNLLTLLGGPGNVRFELTAAGYKSEWLVDDVYLDPYSKH